MEKAILKTLIYADLFDYPLTIYEIHKWLIDKKVTLRQIEKTLGKLVQSKKCKMQSDYYFLKKKNGLISQRRRREEQSAKYLRKVRALSQILKIIPWIKLVGISGGLAVNNAGKTDDIDLFIITSKNRLWVSRLLALGLLSLTRQKRKVGEKGRRAAGKLCVNILLEEDKLEQANKDIFTAHEILQMKVLWQRGGIYEKYLEDNQWVFKYLPNWVGSIDTSLRGVKRRSNLGRISPKSRLPRSLRSLAMTSMENVARKFQLWYMQKPQGLERIEEGALYFHPEDCRLEILSQYQQNLKKIISP
ncbi:MAG: DUF5457 domain-containing protein [Patescibacteria group bacterium]|nr:DUF5457 domain-containing protein [Patescibacteria group bacterium]